MIHPFKAFKNSCNGLKLAFTEDRSWRNTFWQFCAGSVIATIIYFVSNETIFMWLLMVASLFPMVIVETVNSSIEAVTDKASPERSALAMKAKDIGSAAVLVSRLLAILCWIVALSAL
ncbi:MAG: diacylglycerol kinase [Micavibrio aeruginosavorus]|uniref:Diacylglycerol kinase n=1 Tax=Micavibrio aeruginosavorus TaxID=349221 RepID=A0A2W5FIZ1_9BACT|nr:MAG: diacylglycerol kinase [Micavibrio aeruginosavorus]